ncbi:MAG: Ig-like domain-containing protein, partial [Parvularcula sp.]
MFDDIFADVFAHEDLALVRAPSQDKRLSVEAREFFNFFEPNGSPLGAGDIAIQSLSPQTPPPQALPPLAASPNAAVVAGGTVLDALNDFFAALEDDLSISGNLFSDNGAGADVIPDPANTSITRVGGTDVTGTTTLTLNSGAIVTVSPDGSFSFDPNGSYDSLSEGQMLSESLDYTLTDAFGDLTPGTFEALIAASSLSGATGQRIDGIEAAGFSGVSVSGVGDVNADGIDDFLVGSYLAGANDQGAATLYFGDDDGISAANSVRISGVGVEDLAGVSVSGAGDVNGDGIQDLLVGVYRADFSGRTNAGATAVIYGRSGFTGDIDLGFNDPNLGFFIQGAETNDYSGFSVASAGDVNADGFDDIIIGAWPADVGSMFEAGEAYLVFGDPNRQGAFDVTTIDGNNGIRFQGDAADDRFGYSVSAAGDLNGDGVGDFVVGAIHADAGGRADAGAAYIYFGDGSGLNDPTYAAGEAGLVIQGAVAGDRLGSSVASLGDVNGDGIDDLIVGAFQADGAGGQRDAGRAYVYFGDATRTGAVNAGTLNGQDGFEIVGLAADDWTGLAVANAGDLNADGINDIIIGAHLAGPDDAGAAYVVFGRADGSFPASLNLSQLDGTNGFKVTGEGPRSYLGFSVSGAGDVNGDGIDDAIVGSFGVDGNRGASYIIHGRGTFVPLSDTATITVMVTGENDAPVAFGDQGTVIESVGSVSGNVLDNDEDIDEQDVLEVFGIDNGEGGSALAGQSLTLANGTVIVQADGTFTYTANIAPGSIADGLMDTFNYTLTDGIEFVGASVSIFYVNENDAPLAVDDAAAINQGGSTTINVLANDSDPDGDPLTVTLIDQSSHLLGFGDVVLDFVDSGTGPIAGPYGGDNSNFPISVPITHVLDASNVTYVSLPTNSSITVAFANERVFDGQGDDIFISESTGSEQADVFVSADGINFTFLGTAAGSTSFDLASIGFTDDVYAVRLVGKDLGGGSPGFDFEFVQALNFEALVGGSITDNGNGTVSYAAGNAFDSLAVGESRTEAFNYMIEDPDGLMDFATIEVTVNGLNDLPVAVDDSFVAPFLGGSASSVSGNVIQNDTDPDASDVLTVVSVNGQAVNVGQTISLQNGDVTIDQNGALTYDYFGGNAQPGTPLDTVTYTISDGTATSTASVQITLGQGSASLTAVADTLSVSATGSTTLDLFANDDPALGGPFFLVDVDASGLPAGSRFTISNGVLTPDFVDGFGFLAQGAQGSGSLDYMIANSVSPHEFIALGQLSTLGFGSAIFGAAQGAFSGQAVSIIGDVNNDGFDDIAIGAPQLDANGQQAAGGVYVVFGNANESYAPNGLGALGPGEGFLISGVDASSLSGIAVTGMGDVNNDGVDDFAVSAPFTSANGLTSNGAVALVFGDAGLTNTIGFDINDPTHVAFAIGEASQSGFGSSIASAGDINGDGRADAIIGAPTMSSNSNSENGRAYILLGGSPFPGDFVDTANPGGAQLITVTGGDFEGRLGNSVAGVGDFNGDGFDDILVGAKNEDTYYGSYTDAGSAYLLFGQANGPADQIASDVTGADGVRFVTTLPGGLLGSAVAGIGDINGDGFGDIAITAPGASATDSRIYVVFGRAAAFGSGVFNLDNLGAQDGFVLVDSTLSAAANFSVSGAGDVNGDGLDDFIVGNRDSDLQAAALIYGGSFPGIFDIATVDLDGFSGVRFTTEAIADFTGASVSGGGDLNGDGFADVLIGSPGSLSGVGRTYVVQGQPLFVESFNETSTATVDFTVTGVNDAPRAFDDFAELVLGDTLNGDTVGGDVLANDVELDNGETLVVTGVDGGSSVGAQVGLNSGALVTLNADGTFVYDPNGAFDFLALGEVGFDTFSYTVSDDTGLTDTAFVTIRVIGTDGASPGTQAVDDNFTLAFSGNGGTLNADITTNDITAGTPTILAVNGDDLLVDTPFTLRSGASLQVNSDGTISYSENGAFQSLGIGESITDSFSYLLGGGANFPGPAVERAIDANGPALTGGLSIGNEHAGYSMRIVGDVNGDGVDDILIGAPGYYDGQAGGEVGAVYVVFGTGSSTPPSLSLTSLDGTNGFRFVGNDPNAWFGLHVDAGDVNGDGLDDIIVGGGGGYVSGLGSRQGGTAYVLFGSSSGFSASQSVSGLNGSNGFSVYTSGNQYSGSTLGDSVATGDVNGDGIEDLILGDKTYYEPASGRGTGHVFVVFGSNQGFAASLDAKAEIAANRGFVVRPAVGEGLQLGNDVDGIGDFNGDGIDDLIAGAPGDGANREGMATIIFGGSGNAGLEFFTDGLSAVEGLNITNTGNSYSYGGHSVAGIGDFNGDGLDDVAVSVPLQSFPGGAIDGVVAVVFGSTTLTDSIDISQLDGTNGFVIRGDRVGEGNFGIQVEHIGDVNGDGFDDILALNQATYHQFSQGVAYVIYGTDQALPANLDTFAINGVNGQSIVYDDQGGLGSLTGVGGGGGDLDGDGNADILIADANHSLSGNDQSGLILPVTGFDSGGPDSASVYIDLSRTGPPPSASSDIWFGSIFADDVDALGGDDTVVGGGGSDTINGGDGNDVLIGDENVDVDALLASLGLASGPAPTTPPVSASAANPPAQPSLEEGRVLNGTDGDDLLLGEDDIDVGILFDSLGLDQSLTFGPDDVFDETTDPAALFEADPR